MKKLIVLLALFTLVSCKYPVFYFSQPQPGKEKNLSTIPDELLGKWINKEGDSLIVSPKGYSTINIKTDSLNTKTFSIDNNPLSDTLVLKKSGHYYVLNAYEKNSPSVKWTIQMIINKDKNGDIKGYYPLKPPYFGFIKVGNRKTHLLSGGMTIFQEGNLKQKHLKKVVTPQNMVLILKKDGTLLSFDETTGTLK